MNSVASIWIILLFLHRAQHQAIFRCLLRNLVGASPRTPSSTMTHRAGIIISRSMLSFHKFVCQTMKFLYGY